MAGTATEKATGILGVLEHIVVEVATLKRPVTAAAVAAFLLSVTGAIGVDAETLTGIIAAIGAGDAALEKFLGLGK